MASLREPLTAFATVTLAAVTVWLALISNPRLLASAARDYIGGLGWRPIVLIEQERVDGDVYDTPSVYVKDGTLRLNVINVGRGPALDVDCV